MKTVDVAVAQRYAARAREEAAELNRAGDLERARRVLQTTARRIREYAGRNRQMLDLVRELERTAVRHRERFEAMSAEGWSASAPTTSGKRRDVLGRKMRAP